MNNKNELQLELFHTQEILETYLDKIRHHFEVLTDAYNMIRNKHITEPTTIRNIAQQFSIIAANPDARKLFPYDASWAAEILYDLANKIEMRNNAKLQSNRSGEENRSGNLSRQSTPNTDHITVLNESLFWEPNLGTQITREETSRKIDISEQSLEKTAGIFGGKEDLTNGISKGNNAIGFVDQWTALLNFIKTTEEEEKELIAKGIEIGAIDHNDVWNDWEE